jgi:glycosyltransferase involved in cell wall biosynthesis
VSRRWQFRTRIGRGAPAGTLPVDAPVRILFITEFFPDGDRGGVTGGVECRCWYVVKNLSAGFHASVLANLTDGSRWDYASAGSLPRRLVFLLKTVTQGLRADFDLVEGTNLVTFPVAWLLGWLRAKPVVFWYPDVLIGSWGTTSRALGWLGGSVERLTLRLPGVHYIAISEATAAKLRERGVPDASIAVVPCGFDPGLVIEARSQEEPQESRLCVVARLVPYKRTDLAIRLVASLADEYPEVTLTVVGRGPELDRLRALARGLGVGHRVEFTGYLRDHLDVLSAIARSSVYVMPTEMEGFGISLAEAMALNVAAVTTNLPVLREVTDEWRGARPFRKGDLADLTQQVATLLDDAEARTELGRQAADVAQRYTWGEVTRRTEAVYRRALGRDAEIQESL